MKLRGVEFGNVFVPVDSLNTYGRDWNWLDIILKMIFLDKLDLSEVSFVTETVTLNPIGSVMSMDYEDHLFQFVSPYREIDIFEGIILSVPELSNPGIEALLQYGDWQNVEKPKFISITVISKNINDRIKEIRSLVKILKPELPKFIGPVGVQLYIPCIYNGAYKVQKMFRDISVMLEILSELNIPVDLKVDTADMVGSNVKNHLKEIENDKMCDCLTLSNEIPWGTLPGLIEWKHLFGSKKSPFAELGGGRISGKALQSIVFDWVVGVRSEDITIPIKVGGSALSRFDVFELIREGVNAIDIDPGKTIRPWQVPKIIEYMQFLKGD